jgi:ATP-binding cassette subfamily F protein 3
VLDEPTNHLDVESREALEAALEAFPGTLLLVSHDRALLDAVPDRIVAFEDRQLRSYDGGWADMERERDTKSALRELVEPPLEMPTPAPKARPARRKSTELERLEAEIAAVEARISGLERTLADDWTNMDVLGAHRAARDELTALLARWEVLFEEAPAS